MRSRKLLYSPELSCDIGETPCFGSERIFLFSNVLLLGLISGKRIADSEICLVRTFTVSSSSRKFPQDEFEITIRNVGVVTNFLFRQNVRAGLEVPLKGFGGSFTIKQGAKEIVPFVAGGIGITPLLAQIHDLDLARIRLFWTVHSHDTGLVIDTVERCPALGPSTRIFISRLSEQSPEESNLQIQKLEGYGVHVATRRMVASDVEELSDPLTWYLCTGTALRESLLAWLPGKRTVYEDFNY